MNRPDDAFYHDMSAYKFMNHLHGEPYEYDCGVCRNLAEENKHELKAPHYPTTFAEGQYRGDE